MFDVVFVFGGVVVFDCFFIVLSCVMIVRVCFLCVSVPVLLMVWWLCFLLLFIL